MDIDFSLSNGKVDADISRRSHTKIHERGKQSSMPQNKSSTSTSQLTERLGGSQEHKFQLLRRKHQKDITRLLFNGAGMSKQSSRGLASVPGDPKNTTPPPHLQSQLQPQQEHRQPQVPLAGAATFSASATASADVTTNIEPLPASTSASASASASALPPTEEGTFPSDAPTALTTEANPVNSTAFTQQMQYTNRGRGATTLADLVQSMRKLDSLRKEELLLSSSHDRGGVYSNNDNISGGRESKEERSYSYGESKGQGESRGGGSAANDSLFDEDRHVVNKQAVEFLSRAAAFFQQV
jgi:hypothetical protein